MRINMQNMDYKNPQLLKYRKPNHKAEIACMIIGVLVLLFPVFVDMGHPAPITGAIIIGVLVTLVGVVILVDSEKRHKKITRLLSEGIKYTGVITRINHMSRRSRSGSGRWIHSYCAECEVTNSETNEKYLYNSLYTLYNLNGTEGGSLTVYIDPANPADYYVDLTTLEV